MTEIELLDAKGEFWRLRFITCQINKRDGMWYAIWGADEDCPEFLRTNGAQYDWIPAPIVTWPWDEPLPALAMRQAA